MKKKFLSLIWILIPLSVFTSAPAWSEDRTENDRESAIVARSENKKISGLDLSQVRVPIQVVREGAKVRSFVQIKGVFFRPGWALKFKETVLIGNQRLRRQDFTLGIYLTSTLTEVPLIAVNAEGAAENETILISAPGAREVEIGSRPSYWSVLAGMSRFNYFQTNPGDLSSIPLFVGARFRRESIDSFYGIFGEFRMNPFTLSSTPEKQNPQFLETKVLGTLQFRQKKWWMNGLMFTFGGRYSTFLTNGGLYGYQNLIVPSAGLLWSLKKEDRKIFDLQFDYFPIGGLFKVKEFGVEARVEYFPKARIFGLPLSAELRYLKLAYIPVTDSVISMSSLSIGFIYALSSPKVNP
jgi:hypothetical protein